MISIEDLGPRICILGFSNTGKSSLAVAVGQKTGLRVVHLDQLYHKPNTDWVPRDTAEFLHLHRSAIKDDRWIMEGNYKLCIPERLQRATGVILLDVPMLLSLVRYFRRCYTTEARIGGLEGCSDSVSLEMLKYIIIEMPNKRKANRILFNQISLPKVALDSPQLIDEAYEQWGL